MAKIANGGNGAAWTIALGAVVILLGILLAAWHGNEWLKLAVVGDPPYPVHGMPQPDCEPDELEEEGLTLEECYQMALHVHDISVSAPPWFARFHMSVSAAGLALALASVLGGMALLNGRPVATPALLAALGTLVLLDLAGFIGVVKAGPLIRQLYLWTLLLWFFIHLALAAAVLAGLQAGRREPHARAKHGGYMMRQSGYSRSVIVLHVLLAIAIFFLFASSWWMLGLPLASPEFRFREIPFQLHKNIGITLVVLIAAMIWLRFRHRPLPPPADIVTPRTYRLAVADHVILYMLIFACCLSGYLSSSYSGWGTTLWWLVELPYWGHENERLNQLYSDIHLWTCWLLLGVVALHVSGALYHAFRNDGVVRRMLRL